MSIHQTVRRASLRLLVLAGLLAFGFGCSSEPPPFDSDSGVHSDTGGTDGMVSRDGGTPGDGDVPRDSATDGRSDSGGSRPLNAADVCDVPDTSRCRLLNSDLIVAGIDRDLVAEKPAVVGLSDRFVIAYSQSLSNGGSRIAATVWKTAETPSSRTITPGDFFDREPDVAQVGGQLWFAWVSNRDHAFYNVFAQAFTIDGLAAGEPIQLTAESAEAGAAWVNESPKLLDDGRGNPLVLWRRRPVESGTQPSVRVQRVGSPNSVEILGEVAGHVPTRFDSIGYDGGAINLIAWNENQTALSQAFVAELETENDQFSLANVLRVSPTEPSDVGIVRPSDFIELSGDQDINDPSISVGYDVVVRNSSRQVRSLRLNVSGGRYAMSGGAPVEPEARMSETGDNATGSSNAGFRGGYVYAYRQALGASDSRIKVLFARSNLGLTRVFDFVSEESPLGLTTSSGGGATSVAVSGADEVLVVWNQLDATRQVRAARIVCR